MRHRPTQGEMDRLQALATRQAAVARATGTLRHLTPLIGQRMASGGDQMRAAQGSLQRWADEYVRRVVEGR
ncbi:MAG: hypothetical protein KF809_17460 [Chloroflexi bacterium]|nr:hypothetical protein [Chloroflexota bacterium]